MTKEKLDPFKMFVHADDFYRTLHYLTGNDDPEHMSAVAFPTMVLAAFASELFLKCIICMEGRPVPKWHDLKSLYDLTSKPARQRMEHHWALIIQHRKPMFDRIEKRRMRKSRAIWRLV